MTTVDPVSMVLHFDPISVVLHKYTKFKQIHQAQSLHRHKTLCSTVLKRIIKEFKIIVLQQQQQKDQLDCIWSTSHPWTPCNRLGMMALLAQVF